MKRVVRILAVVYCLTLAIGAAHATQQEELENLRKRISTMQRDVEQTSESRDAAADALRESERAISDSNRTLAALATQQRIADHQLNQLQTQQQQLDRSLTGQQVLLGRLLYQQYLSGTQTYSKLILNNQNPNRIAREIQYYGYIARNRAAWLASLRNNLQQVQSVRSQTSETRSQLAVMQNEQKTQQRDLQKQQQARQQMLLKVSQKLRSQRSEIKHLQANENRLAQLVEKLTQLLAKPAGKSILHNEKLPDNRFAGKPFAELKGRLTLPVKGDILNRFGSARPDSTVLWKGIQIKAAQGQMVKAIASGRVVFADWLRGFGNLLIVDHGTGYMSLYGNNETLYKQVGDELQGGETIASVGNSGGNEDSGLYFELRLASKPLDPLKWFATK
ncbi:MAG: murein hydrolase activator EnvC family protein [Gallionella sp.]